MKIGFHKVGSQAIPFEITKGDLKFSGTLNKFSGSLIELEAKIAGSISLSCDICAEEFVDSLSESVKFHLCDGVHSGSDDDEYDIVEIEGSMIDLDEILASEIELYKSGYFSCPRCQENGDDIKF